MEIVPNDPNSNGRWRKKEKGMGNKMIMNEISVYEYTPEHTKVTISGAKKYNSARDQTGWNSIAIGGKLNG